MKSKLLKVLLLTAGLVLSGCSSEIESADHYKSGRESLWWISGEITNETPCYITAYTPSAYNFTIGKNQSDYTKLTYTANQYYLRLKLYYQDTLKKDIECIGGGCYFVVNYYEEEF